MTPLPEAAGGNIGRAVSVVSNYGRGSQRARQDGADETGQMLSGATAVGADIAADKFFGTVLPFSDLYGGGSIEDAMKRRALHVVESVAETEIGQKVMNFVAKNTSAAVIDGLKGVMTHWAEEVTPLLYGGDTASATKILSDSLYEFMVKLGAHIPT